jgi:hypothetical protein
MKWAGMYLVGFLIVIGALLAAAWKLGLLQHVDKFWIGVGIALVVGVGIMLSVSKSGTKESISIDK